MDLLLGAKNITDLRPAPCEQGRVTDQMVEDGFILETVRILPIGTRNMLIHPGAHV